MATFSNINLIDMMLGGTSYDHDVSLLVREQAGTPCPKRMIFRTPFVTFFSCSTSLDSDFEPPHDPITIIVPTLFGTNASGNSRAIKCVAFQPVQCCGTMTLKLNSLSA